jgi:hypothetical protein
MGEVPTMKTRLFFQLGIFHLQFLKATLPFFFSKGWTSTSWANYILQCLSDCNDFALDSFILCPKNSVICSLILSLKSINNIEESPYITEVLTIQIKS